MEKNVLVCVKGLHYTDDNKVKDEVEVTTTGIYLENNGDKYVRFEEVLDDKSVVKNIIKISGDTVDATKKGAVDMQIHFREKMKFITPYMTPYGAIQLGVFTDKIEIGFKCNCSKERIARALAGLSRKELDETINDGKEIEVKCDFCNTTYKFSIEELQTLRKKFL